MILGASAALHAAELTRVRGTIENVDANSLKVKSREGQDVTVQLKPGWAVTGVVAASVADIKPGDFVGIASQPTDNGVAGAIEVVIFPAAMKGTGEGDRPWDVKPNSSMTNATVANVVKSVNGPTLTLAFQGKEKKINIPEGTPIVTFAPATKDDVKPGAGVFIMGDSAGAERVVVGLHGIAPPM
ncbi:hypothetical protein AB4048_00920 [Rhizobium sp. RAF56]